jgi:DNA-binding beta-propeller fold protein YncE
MSIKYLNAQMNYASIMSMPKALGRFYLVAGLIMSSLSNPLMSAEPKAPLIDYREVMELTGTPKGNMLMPTDIAIGKQQRIYVVDSGNHRVLTYASDGSYLFAFGSHGSGAGQLDSPVGISTTGDGRVLVADRGNHRIQIFDSEGAFIKTIPTTVGKSPVMPVDVAVDKKGKRIIVTASAPYHAVLVFDNNGKIKGVWGKPGNNQGEFRYPATLAVSGDNESYIVDVFNSRVQVLDNEGKFLVSVGTWGVTPGHLFRPKGVVIENDGQILVSDSYLGVIQIYNSDTRFRAVLGEKGEIARFDTPAGMAVDKQNRLYVAQMLANKVTVIQQVRGR